MGQLSEDLLTNDTGNLPSFAIKTACKPCLANAQAEVIDLRAYRWNHLLRMYGDQPDRKAFCCLLEALSTVEVAYGNVDAEGLYVTVIAQDDCLGRRSRHLQDSSNDLSSLNL
jgi:hypothetical protein